MPESFIPVWMSVGEARDWRAWMAEMGDLEEFPEREHGILESALAEEKPRTYDQMQAERSGALAAAVRGYVDQPSGAGMDRILAALDALPCSTQQDQPVAIERTDELLTECANAVAAASREGRSPWSTACSVIAAIERVWGTSKKRGEQ